MPVCLAPGRPAHDGCSPKICQVMTVWSTRAEASGCAGSFALVAHRHLQNVGCHTQRWMGSLPALPQGAPLGAGQSSYLRSLDPQSL